MEIARNSLSTQTGPSDWFTGTVFIDTVATPSEASRLGAAMVHFTPDSRTAWHTHPHRQTIHVIEGICRCQWRGGPIEVIRPGDRAFFAPGEDHWHGAAPDRFMTHLAMQQRTSLAAPSPGASTSPMRSTASSRDNLTGCGEVGSTADLVASSLTPIRTAYRRRMTRR
jgi:quercetin dioxygenase-like cupin family protein